MDFYYNLSQNCNVIYDIETFPNFFCMNVHVVETGGRFVITDLDEIRLFARLSADYNANWVGFNNEGFDYPIIHAVLLHKSTSISHIYEHAMRIIDTTWNSRFSNRVWDSDKFVKQIDLFMIHHFDNPSRATSLKVLEINMKMADIRPLPFYVGTVLNDEQKQTLIDYCWHDIDATLRFYNESLPAIEFRQSLSAEHGESFTNFNDTKIGKTIFQSTLNANNITCSRDLQTIEPTISLNDCIIPSLSLEHPEFNRVLNHLRAQTVYDQTIKGVFTNVSATIDGFTYDFGAGGLHGSVDSQVVSADDDYMIVDIDVASYYPSIAIQNEFYPQHLSDRFCTIYNDMFVARRGYPKSDPRNAALKLALNGVYGDSNNKYSPFYDTSYTLKITLNGQFLLCMLAEQLHKVEDMTMIQVNTDGVTIRIPRSEKLYVDQICQWWESNTGMILEQAEYSKMFIRDVNNYVAIYTNGNLKSKGAYAHTDLDWSKDHSALIVQKAVEAFFVNGIPIEDTILACTDPFDFAIKAKVPRSNRLMWGDTQVDNILRYYVSTNGDRLTEMRGSKEGCTPGQYKRANKLTDSYFNAIMDEIGQGVWDKRIHTKNRSTYQLGTAHDIQSGYTVVPANHIDGMFDEINYDWYIAKANKLRVS